MGGWYLPQKTTARFYDFYREKSRLFFFRDVHFRIILRHNNCHRTVTAVFWMDERCRGPLNLFASSKYCCYSLPYVDRLRWNEIDYS